MTTTTLGPDQPTDDSDELAVGKLRFGKAQNSILVLLVTMVGLIAALGYRSSLVVGEQTEALNNQLQLVSGNMVSLEREVMTYALVVDRWVHDETAMEDVELSRALVERHLRITANEAAADPELGLLMERLTADLARVDSLVDHGHVDHDTAERIVLTDAVNAMTTSVKRLFDATERQNFVYVHALQESLGGVRRTEWVVAGLILLLVAVMVFSLRRMLANNYATARSALQREQARYDVARAEKARVENRYREVVDVVSDVVFRVDADQRWTLLNRAWVTLTGVPIENVLGRSMTDFFHPDDRDRVASAIAPLIDGTCSQCDEQIRLVRADGVQLTVIVNARATHDDDSGDVYVAGTVVDVTVQVRAQQLAAAQTEVLELVALDRPLQFVLGRIVDLIGPHAPGAEFHFVTNLDHLNPQVSGSIPLTDLSRGEQIGALEWTSIPGMAHNGQLDSIAIAGQLGALAIDRRLAADRIVYQASHDALTGLPNRARLMERAEGAIERTTGAGDYLALMFLDVDRFKVVNDSLGHKAGDRLLIEIADRLSNAVRAVDTVARLGGDEFVVLMEGIRDVESACSVAEKILAAVAEPVDLGTHTAQVTTSIGVVVADGSTNVGELMVDADVAMYRAKQAGRATYELFDEEMKQWASHRHATEMALKGAIDRDEMEVYYQPLVHLDTGRLKGFEALVRWRRPGIGLVPPSDFIELAEELGFIGPLDTWVLETAARQLRVWHETVPEITVSVNVSGRDLVRADYVESTAELIRSTGVSPESLVLEITESVLVEDTEGVQRCLHGLKELGFRLAIDDFGTGYSSLQYLRQLPVDILKIDRAFVSTMTDPDLHDPTIVNWITELGHGFGLEVLAEGVETEQQRSAVRALGVDSGQGYYFGRPEPALEVLDLQPLAGRESVKG